MRLALAGMVLALAAHADIITLKSGRIVNGTYIGGTPRQVRVEVGDAIETYDVSDIVRIEFSNGASSSSRSNSSASGDDRPTLRRTGGSAAPPPANAPVMIQPDPSDPRTQSGSGGGGGFGSSSDRPTLRRNTGSGSDSGSTSASTSSSSDDGRPTLRRAPGSESDAPPQNAAPTAPKQPAAAQGASPEPVAPAQPAAPVTIPAPTSMVVRMIEAIDSEKAKEGQTFAASLDQPIAIDGQVVLPKGTEMTVKLVQAQQSGKFTGKTELTVSLWAVNIKGKIIDIDTQNITEASSSRGAQTAKVAGGAAAVGAVIGAIAGGGKGAAIGAGAGGAGGAAVQAATKGQRVKIESETLLTFVTDKPLTI